MKFRVRWSRQALEAVAAAWANADPAFRQAITRATHQVDQALQQDPRGAGESRPGGRRVLLVAPIGVIYRIEADGQTVSVLRMWSFRAKP